jgi:hypothetical protein
MDYHDIVHDFENFHRSQEPKKQRNISIQAIYKHFCVRDLFIFLKNS